jgi:hypothetical protein
MCLASVALVWMRLYCSSEQQIHYTEPAGSDQTHVFMSPDRQYGVRVYIGEGEAYYLDIVQICPVQRVLQAACVSDVVSFAWVGKHKLLVTSGSIYSPYLLHQWNGGARVRHFLPRLGEGDQELSISGLAPREHVARLKLHNFGDGGSTLRWNYADQRVVLRPKVRRRLEGVQPTKPPRSGHWSQEGTTVE